jgi:Flp pilus assembly protein TadG
MRSRIEAESGIRVELGAITAEFAAAVPAVILVLACSLAAIQLGGEQLRLQSAAFDAARLLGRGEAGSLARIRTVSSDATLSARKSGESICADARATASLGVLSGIVLTASACALDDAQL